MRFYKIGRDLYPSVTTLLAATRPKGKVNKFEEARVKYDEEHGEGAWEARRCKAAARGEALHKYGEFCLGAIDECEYPSGYDNYVTALLGYMASYRFDRVIATELPVYSHKLEIAGRIDWLGVRDNVVTLVDLKTFSGYTDYHGNPVNQWQVYARDKQGNCKTGWGNLCDRVKDTFMQLACYKHCIEEMQLVMNVDALRILVLCPDANFQVIEFPPQYWSRCVSAISKKRRAFRVDMTDAEIIDGQQPSGAIQ